MKRSILTMTMLLLIVGGAQTQSPPHITLPLQQPPQLFERDETMTLEGAVAAYDWSSRSYMEGARLEDFVFRIEGANPPAHYVRVRLLWHPADRPTILPDNFYVPRKLWRLTLRTWSPFDFVRNLCSRPVSQTVSVQTDTGTVELPRYVDVATLPPNAGLYANWNSAMKLRPEPAHVPNPQNLPCLFLAKVDAASK